MTLRTFRCAQSRQRLRRRCAALRCTAANCGADSRRLSELASKEHTRAPADKSGASAGKGAAPCGGHDAPAPADEELAREFWRSVEQRPPLYGADLQLSLFDKELPVGCVLRACFEPACRG
jgi:hypothetical protein